MSDWSVPQWVMAIYLLLDAVAPAVTYGIVKARGYPVRLTWPEFRRARLADTIGKAFILAILIWGGFF